MIGGAGTPNTASGNGGGIYNTSNNGTVTIDASSVSHNAATGTDSIFNGDGGGIFNFNTGDVIIQNVRAAQKEAGDSNVGYDVLTEEYVNMLTVGIIDPAKVTRGALENAASIAAMILTTEALITDLPEPEAPSTATEVPAATAKLISSRMISGPAEVSTRLPRPMASTKDPDGSESMLRNSRPCSTFSS